MAWQQIKISSNAEQAELITDWLHEHGALSTTLSDADDAPIFEPEPQETPLWPSVLITALFDEDFNTQSLLTAFTAQFPEQNYQQEILEEQNWHQACMEDFKPMQFGERIWICPTWCEPPNPDAINIRLDPGMAFGTGTHATTALCLSWLDAHPPTDKTVIDYGCGSGILSLAALKLNAKTVWAVDHCSQALEATQYNLSNNQIDADRCHTVLPENFPKVDAELILANILMQPLLDLAANFAVLQTENNQIVLSGILREQAPKIIDCYQQWYDLAPTQYQDEWACISGVRKK